MWNPNQSKEVLFNRYLSILDRIRRVRRNRFGVYFQRMIAYGPQEMNQLKHVIETYGRRNRRVSGLQISVFDPLLDHTNEPRRGFPCLQQVNFILGEANTVQVAGVYALQYLIDRAYGNYLGLCRLGEFFAHETNRTLTGMQCMVPKAALGNVNKTAIKPLVERLRQIIDE
jgi:hypothetical protein